MSIPLLLGIALMTFGSRAIALVLMPDPPAHVRAILDRVPAPLFASLAAVSLVPEGDLVAAPTLCAAAGALAATPTRSLLWVLIAGLSAFLLGDWIF